MATSLHFAALQVAFARRRIEGFAAVQHSMIIDDQRGAWREQRR